MENHHLYWENSTRHEAISTLVAMLCKLAEGVAIPKKDGNVTDPYFLSIGHVLFFWDQYRQIWERDISTLLDITINISWMCLKVWCSGL